MPSIQSEELDRVIEKLRRAYEEALGSGGLSALERAAIGVAVAVSNECQVHVRQQVEVLRTAGGSADLIERLLAGEEPEDQPERLVRLVYYARKLTLLPGAMSKQDIGELRGVGLTDREIRQAAVVVGYYNWVNRLEQGLGSEGGGMRDEG